MHLRVGPMAKWVEAYYDRATCINGPSHLERETMSQLSRIAKGQKERTVAR